MMMMMMLFFCWKHCRKCQAPETSQFIHSVKKKKRTSTRWTKWHFTSKHFTIWSSFDNNNSEQKRKPVFLLFSELSCKWTSTLNGQRKKNQNQSQTNKKTFIKIDSFIISIHIHFEGVFLLLLLLLSIQLSCLCSFVRSLYSQ